MQTSAKADREKCKFPILSSVHPLLSLSHLLSFLHHRHCHCNHCHRHHQFHHRNHHPTSLGGALAIKQNDDDDDGDDDDPACYRNIVLCVICCHFLSTEASLALEPAEAHLDIALSTGALHCTSTTHDQLSQQIHPINHFILN